MAKAGNERKRNDRRDLGRIARQGNRGNANALDVVFPGSNKELMAAVKEAIPGRGVRVRDAQRIYASAIASLARKAKAGGKGSRNAKKLLNDAVNGDNTPRILGHASAAAKRRARGR